MSVEKHAEAAAKDIASWLRKECHIFPSVRNIADWATIISHHEESAIDEATATLKARIAELEGLGPLIEELKVAAIEYGEAPNNSDKEYETTDRMIRAENQIDAILKGGGK